MQELGIDTKDWNRINEFCRHPRIMGKDFALITVSELEQLSVKLRAIKRKGGLKQQEGINTNHIKLMFIENGTGKEQTGAGGCKAGQLPS